MEAAPWAAWVVARVARVHQGEWAQAHTHTNARTHTVTVTTQEMTREEKCTQTKKSGRGKKQFKKSGTAALKKRIGRRITGI